MTATDTNIAFNAVSKTTNTAEKPGFFRSALNWIAASDKSYREMRELEGLDNERLYDIGVSREEFNAVFHKQFGRSPEDQVARIMRIRYPF